MNKVPGDLILQGVGMTSKRTRDRLVSRLREQGITHKGVLDVMGSLPRHLFVDEALAHRAYEDTALPIGFKQTISQPYIVARMTEILLNAMPNAGRVLEIGTGSGYQTTVLSQLVRVVYSVERIKPLYDKTRLKLQHFGIRNVKLSYSDGCCGWEEKAPFDGIITCAAPEHIPGDLKSQLGPDGVLVIPVGGQEQSLTVIKRVGDSDSFELTVKEPVCFVPLLEGVDR